MDMVSIGRGSRLIKLLRGNCMQLMPQHARTSTVDLVLCDPPYGTTTINWDKVLPFDRLWEEYDRVLRPGGVVVLFGSMPFTACLVLSNPKWFKYCLVWDKNKCGSPGLAKYRPMKVHEDIAVFVKPGARPTYNPQMVSGTPYYRKGSSKVRCNEHGYGFGLGNEITNNGTRYPTSILRIPRDFSAQQQVHPTQKPVALMRWLVRTFSNTGDLVLDNCTGSGPVPIACYEEKRRCIAIEKTAKHFATCVRRVKEVYQLRRR